jgi:hypothetical protein
MNRWEAHKRKRENGKTPRKTIPKPPLADNLRRNENERRRKENEEERTHD